ncbi:LysR substrate-binding domain-containing protein [Streptomyces sp. NPDC026092]|uniref:LysR substrate-binding domain-containing protein n=1 Tax=Streptomyces sp. NPDC026092 TaxID=3154797 RepID=UPI0033C1EF2F
MVTEHFPECRPARSVHVTPQRAGGNLPTASAHRPRTSIPGVRRTVRSAQRLVRAGDRRKPRSHHHPQVAGEYHRRYPQVAVTLTGASSPSLLGKVRDGEIDAAVVAGPPEGTPATVAARAPGGPHRRGPPREPSDDPRGGGPRPGHQLRPRQRRARVHP